jgi:H+/gluconate symporter-like permease
VKDVEGGVEVVFYVKMQNTDGIMDVDVLENAVQSGIEDGTFANAGFTDMAVHKTVPPTTGGLSSAASAGLAIGLIILIIIALSVVILVIVVWLKLKTRAYEVDKNILVDNVDSMSNRSSYIEIEGVTPRLEAELIAPPPMSEKEKEKFEEAKNEESSTSKL